MKIKVLARGDDAESIKQILKDFGCYDIKNSFEPSVDVEGKYDFECGFIYESEALHKKLHFDALTLQLQIDNSPRTKIRNLFKNKIPLIPNGQ